MGEEEVDDALEGKRGGGLAGVNSAGEHNIGFMEFFRPSFKLEERKERFADPGLFLLAFVGFLCDGEQIDGPPLDTLYEKLVVEVDISVVVLIEIVDPLFDLVEILLGLFIGVGVVIGQIYLFSFLYCKLEMKFKAVL